jgi:hypothetical protein
MRKYMTILRIIGFLLIVTLMGLSGCGGGSGGGAGTTFVGTWGISTKTDTFNADNSLTSSIIAPASSVDCTYSGGSYSVSGNTMTVPTLPNATPSSKSQAAFCATPTLAGYTATYSINPISGVTTGNSIDFTDTTTNSVTTEYSLAGQWQGTLADPHTLSGFGATLTLNINGTYSIVVIPIDPSTNNAINGTCILTGGTYTASGELMTLYRPTQVRPTGNATLTTNTSTATPAIMATDCLLAVYGAFQFNSPDPAINGKSTNWISINEKQLTVTETANMSQTHFTRL